MRERGGGRMKQTKKELERMSEKINVQILTPEKNNRNN